MEIKNIAKLSSYGAYIDEEFIYTNSIVEGKNVIVGDIAEYMYDLEQEMSRLKKNGSWLYSEKGCVIKCSNCGERLELCYPDGTEIRATKYCPNCGAKMRDLTGGMRCRPIRIEVQNLVYLMGEWAIENNMCWNDEHAKKLAYNILDNKYRKESDTAREIFEKIFEVLCLFTTQGKSENYNEGYIDCIAEVDKRLQNLAKEEYGVDLED